MSHLLSDHPDWPNAMTAPTPRTDAVRKAILEKIEPLRRLVKGGVSLTFQEAAALEVILNTLLDHAETLERDLATAQERAQRAEERAEANARDAERWRFFASSKQTALMLGSSIDPINEEVTQEKCVAECNQLADAAIDAAIKEKP